MKHSSPIRGEDLTNGEATIMGSGVLSFLYSLMSAAFLFALVSFSPASAATVTVQSTADGTANAANCPGASCRLRDAIAYATPGDTIDFSVMGTIAIGLAADPFIIAKDLTITGPGAANLTISGGGVSGVFVTLSGNVTISGLTISDGSAPFAGGGGIGNGAILKLTDVVVSGNSADTGGGIYNIGTATLTNVTLSGNSASSDGGGISNAIGGTLTVANCTLSENSAPSGGGGGIETLRDSTLTVTNSTFTKNSALSGGGIENEWGSATLTNCTFSENAAPLGAGGGITNSNGILTLTNCTLSGNAAFEGAGGGIWNVNGSVSLRNTIVANSTSGSNCAGTTAFTSLGHNLEYPGPTTCNFTAGGDVVGLDPQLGPLALNAPGTTETMALPATSPAIDKGDNSNLPPTDQRGADRIRDGDGNGSAIVDIGAYEYVALLYDASVPTMNEAGMILFMLIAGFGAIYFLRAEKRS